MADVQKYNASNFGAFAHDERNLNNPVQYRKNYEIKAERTHLNYDLISGKTGETAEHGELQKRLEARLAQLTIRKRRANTVLFGSWVVTLPAELKEVSMEKQREFFQHTVQFIKNRYGEENVIGAWVHNDETTPHVHVKFVPEERKKTFGAEGKDITDYNRHEGTGVLLGKDIFKRGEYQTFHRDLQKYLELKMGMRLSILNGVTLAQGGNKSVARMKEETVLAEEKAQEAALAAAAAGQKMAEAGALAEALVEHYGAAVKDAKRMAEGGSLFGKSGWQKRLEKLEEEQAALMEQVQAAAKVLQGALNLIPAWAKSGSALMEAAARMVERERKKTADERDRWQQWRRRWEEKLQAKTAALDEREAGLEAIAEERAEAKLQTRRDEVSAIETRRVAAEAAAQDAEMERDRLVHEQQKEQGKLDDLQHKTEQAQRDLEKADKLRKEAEEGEKAALQEAERLRQGNTPEGLLQEALAACVQTYGADLTREAVNEQLGGFSNAWDYITGELTRMQQRQQGQSSSPFPQ